MDKWDAFVVVGSAVVLAGLFLISIPLGVVCLGLAIAYLGWQGG